MQTAVLQIVPTWGEACGISNFAALMGQAIDGAGHHVQCSRTLTAQPGVTLLHFHPELFSTRQIKEYLDARQGPVVLVPHEGENVLEGAAFDGYLDLRDPEAVRRPSVPVLRLGHPTWTPDRLQPRRELRRMLGLPQDSLIIGSNGFLKRDRKFPSIVSALLPWARQRGHFLYLATSRWRELSPDVEAALEELQCRYPGTFRYETSFKTWSELNIRLQACDVLWTWTSTAAQDYVSGVTADQYASGTRMVVSRRPAHAAVLGLANVWAGPEEIDGFTEQLKATADASAADRGADGVPRHDPGLLSWRAVRDQLAGFLSAVRKGPVPEEL